MALVVFFGLIIAMLYGFILGKHWGSLPAFRLGETVKFRAHEVGAEHRLKVVEIHYEKGNYFMRLE